MAKIYISYNNNDRDFTRQLTDNLNRIGHEVTVDSDILLPGQDWRHTLTEALKTSEVFVVVISENSMRSQYVLSEIGAARAYATESEAMLLIPVIIDQVPVPPVIADLHAIVNPNRDADYTAEAIDRAISAFLGRKAAKEEQAAEVARLIEVNAAEYIDEAIQSLKALESQNRLLGTIWYVVGFFALLSGITFAFYGVSTLGGNTNRGWSDFAILTLKTVVIIGLLSACAKYGFTLGKSYVSESLKSADRIHAISFGKFFLRVFGAKATWPELKDAFQHWNIDRASTFTSLDTSQFDPKLIESLIEIARLLSAKMPGKK